MKKEGLSFWDHLDELRRVLFRSALVVLLFLVVIFPSKKFLFDKVIFAPTSDDFVLFRWFKGLTDLLGLPADPSSQFSLELINIELPSQFFTHINVSLMLSLILAVPFILYQFWLFVKPGLYEKERKSIRRGFGFASILFLIGVVVGYFFVFPLTLRFLSTYQVSEKVVNQISLRSYISMFSWLILIMGVVFELPALALILSKLGVINKALLKKYRRHAFTALMIVAAIITPSGDAFTLLVVGLPLYLLYEFSILICRDIN